MELPETERSRAEAGRNGRRDLAGYGLNDNIEVSFVPDPTRFRRAKHRAAGWWCEGAAAVLDVVGSRDPPAAELVAPGGAGSQTARPDLPASSLAESRPDGAGRVTCGGTGVRRPR